MSHTYVRAEVDLAKHGITCNNLQNILDIDDISANELFTGVIPIKKEELEKIAKQLSVSIEAIITLTAF